MILKESLAMRRHYYVRLLSIVCAAMVLGSFMALFGQSVYAQYNRSQGQQQENQPAVNERVSGQFQVMQLQIDQNKKTVSDLQAWIVKQQSDITALQSEVYIVKGIGFGASGILLLFQIISFAFKPRSESGDRRSGKGVTQS